MSSVRRSSVGVIDLARELGVSTATVSRALNGSNSVRAELADRIREHAESRGYVANRLARALSAATSRAFVGFVIPYVDTPAYSVVAAECARLLSSDGTQMILAITDNDPDRELQSVKELIGSRVAGLIIAPSSRMAEGTRRLLEELPVVEIHRRSGIAAPGVFTDDAQTMAQCVLHLAALGHTRIAYVGGPEEISNGAERLRGMRQGMQLAGLDPDALVLRLVDPTRENGRDAGAELLAGGSEFTGLVVGSGSLSVGVAEAVRASGRCVPDELSVVVYGDPAWFALADPPLTIVHVSYVTLAQTAARLLLAALDLSRVGSEPVVEGSQLISAELRLGGSTGPPPSGARRDSSSPRRRAGSRPARSE